MAKWYRPVDREQPFLMPPDMREWLPADHPVWVLLEVVRLLDTAELHAKFKAGGAGRAGYDPDMMLALLCHSYSLGITSSRQIERLCGQDVAFRVICAQDVPDHTTIWRFVNSCMQVVEKLFTEVLVLCAKAGMGKLETITLDGTKIGTNASKAANRTEERIRAELERVCAAVVAKHKATDAAEDALFGVEARGDELPEDLGDPRKRETRLRAALADLQREREAEQAERDAKAAAHLRRVQDGQNPRGRPPTDAEVRAAQLRLAQAVAEQQAKIDDWERRNADKLAATGKALRGPHPVEEHSTVKRARAALAKSRRKQAEREQQKKAPTVRNTTDPDTRLMPTKNGFVQGLNAQNVVCADHLIMATELVQDTGDVDQWVPMMEQAENAADLITGVQGAQARAAGEVCTCPPEAGSHDRATPADSQPTTPQQPRCAVHPKGIGIAVGDAGYLSYENLTAPGPDRLIATGKRRDVEKAARDAETTSQTSTSDNASADVDASRAGAQPLTDDTRVPPTASPSADSAAEPDTETPIEAMAQRLKTPEGMKIYRQRGHIAETPHGHIKHNMGIRCLTRRSLPRLREQWKFVCAVYNIGRLQNTLRATGQKLPVAA